MTAPEKSLSRIGSKPSKTEYDCGNHFETWQDKEAAFERAQEDRGDEERANEN